MQVLKTYQRFFNPSSAWIPRLCSITLGPGTVLPSLAFICLLGLFAYGIFLHTSISLFFCFLSHSFHFKLESMLTYLCGFSYFSFTQKRLLQSLWYQSVLSSEICFLPVFRRWDITTQQLTTLQVGRNLLIGFGLEQCVKSCEQTQEVSLRGEDLFLLTFLFLHVKGIDQNFHEVLDALRVRGILSGWGGTRQKKPGSQTSSHCAFTILRLCIC